MSKELVAAVGFVTLITLLPTTTPNLFTFTPPHLHLHRHPSPPTAIAERLHAVNEYYYDYYYPLHPPPPTATPNIHFRCSRVPSKDMNHRISSIAVDSRKLKPVVLLTPPH